MSFAYACVSKFVRVCVLSAVVCVLGPRSICGGGVVLEVVLMYSHVCVHSRVHAFCVQWYVLLENEGWGDVLEEVC